MSSSQLAAVGRRSLPAALACLVFSASCGPPAPVEGTATRAEGPPEAPAGRVINVETLELAPREFVEVIRLTAVAAANRDATIAAEESGRVSELFAEEGAWVEAGEAILKIDDSVLEPQVEQARAAAELAQETWDRRRRLFEEDSVGSEIAYLDAKFGAEQASAFHRSLAARLARTTVRAPFAGVVEALEVELGESVAPGQPVARLVDLNSAKVIAGVPERYAPDVEVGDEATVSFDVLEETVTARISRVGATVDPKNRTFQVEMRVPGSGGRIKPEMVADVLLIRRRLASVMVVPQDAVVRAETGYVAFVTVPTDAGRTVVEIRSIELGPAADNEVVIESGLAEGDRLVVVGHRSVADGDIVSVVGERW